MKILFGLIISTLLYSRRDCLHYSVKDAFGRYDRPEKDTFAISPSGHFYIHYDTTGNAAPDLLDFDQNGVPDFVDEVSVVADSAHHVLVNLRSLLLSPTGSGKSFIIYELIRYYVHKLRDKMILLVVPTTGLVCLLYTSPSPRD